MTTALLEPEVMDLPQLGELFEAMGRNYEAVVYRPDLEETLEGLRVDADEAFKSQTDVFGTPWIDHSVQWEKSKGFFYNNLWTHALWSSLTGDGADSIADVEDNSLSWGSSVESDGFAYGAWLQLEYGPKKGGSRIHTAITEERIDQLTERIADRTVTVLVESKT